MRKLFASAFQVASLLILIVPIQGLCSADTYQGGVSVTFCDSLAVGVPNRLLVKAYTLEGVDTAVLLIHLPSATGAVSRDGIAIWTGRTKPFDIIVAEYPIAAMGFGDYRYVATLKFVGRTYGQLQIGGALSARLTKSQTRWIEGDHWQIDVQEINELIEKAGMTGQPHESILKSLPEVRERVERLRGGGSTASTPQGIARSRNLIDTLNDTIKRFERPVLGRRRAPSDGYWSPLVQDSVETDSAASDGDGL